DTYAEELLERAHMKNCNPCRTPVDINSKLGPNGDPIVDPTLYHSLAGALQYLTFTCLDLSYVVQQLHVSNTAQLIAYMDADWVGCLVTRRSTSSYCVFLICFLDLLIVMLQYPVASDEEVREMRSMGRDQARKKKSSTSSGFEASSAA
nr:ribonuclease H-like domain-containing protein [Tanacetum cinerariifolium]